MMWEIAAGILVASAILGIVFLGLHVAMRAHETKEMPEAVGWLIALIGVGLGAWVVIAHWHW